MTDTLAARIREIGQKIEAGEAGQYEAAILWQALESAEGLITEAAGKHVNLSLVPLEERAKAFYESGKYEGDYDFSLSSACQFAAAFALSELSAAETAERERCCKDVCEVCRDPNYEQPTYFKRHDFEEPSWWHMRTSPSETEKDNVLCAADAIRNRE